jgi:hypothetical protein
MGQPADVIPILHGRGKFCGVHQQRASCLIEEDIRGPDCFNRNTRGPDASRPSWRSNLRDRQRQILSHFVSVRGPSLVTDSVDAEFAQAGLDV